VEQLTDDDLDYAQYFASENGHEEIIKLISKVVLSREKKNKAKQNEVTG